VLVLSRFAGAARQLTDALIVNPYAPEELADALHAALAMPLAERVRRWEAMMEGVMRDDVRAWRDRFVAALEAASAGPETEWPRLAAPKSGRWSRWPDRGSAASAAGWRTTAPG
jgi:trehalose 6-phosphate synthase